MARPDRGLEPNQPADTRRPDLGRTEQGDAAADGELSGAAQVAGARETELQNRLRRALADAQNVRKRCERQVAEARGDERARVATMWLSIVDNFERALAHAEADPGAVKAGLEAVREQAVAVLAALGFPRLDSTDVPFDPQLHEAVSVAHDGGAPAGTVVEVLRPGYGTGTRQLRPAAVVVASGPD